MLRVVEAFSGIGSQAQALRNIGAEFEIAATIEWDINAAYAYDIIHNGEQRLSEVDLLESKQDLISFLLRMGVSINGKEPATLTALRTVSEKALRSMAYALRRTNNLVDVTNVSATDLPNKVDVLTYSFPCQDLSISGSWHGNMSGIRRDANNRSGMLWEIERIIKEHKNIGKKLPRFLLMENVYNILSKAHNGDFDDWKDTLTGLGYINHVFTLNAMDFGIPQDRRRTFMLSVHCEDKRKAKELEEFFSKHSLEGKTLRDSIPLKEFLRTDYSDEAYHSEAEESNPNFTPSRKKIHQDNEYIFDGTDAIRDSVRTITTKQDRNPNSGLIKYKNGENGKAPYRNLTPRECFLLMGFNEEAFDSLMKHNVELRKERRIFAREKLIKLAGNSIVVQVLEEIFLQILFIKKHILKSTMNEKSSGNQLSIENVRTDVHTKAQRSYNMSRIRSKDTTPERIVRSYLHRNGFRFRVCAGNLFGKPDIVLPKYRTVIFVHGCFWHGHENCRFFVEPKANADSWKKKFDDNKRRDVLTQQKLSADGWKVIIIWECELKPDKRKETLEHLQKTILDRQNSL